MNLLTDIKIKGEIFLEYAFLSYDLSFNNNTEQPLSAEYSFTLPQNCVVSDMKIIKPDGNIISTAVVSLSHASAIWNSSNCAILRRVDKTTYRLNLDGISNGTCHVLIHIYVPLIRCDRRRRLTIPQSNSDISTKIEIFARAVNADEVTATYNSQKIIKTDGILISVDNFNEDNDFIITVCDIKTQNSAIIVQNSNGGEMLCRVIIPPSNGRAQRPSPTISPQNETPHRSFPTSPQQTVGYSVYDAPIAVRRKHPRVASLAFGNSPSPPNPTNVSLARRGRCPHRPVTPLAVEGYNNGLSAHIISHSQDNITLYIKYRGDIPPAEFDIDYMGEKLHITLDRAEIYKSFAPIKLVYAEALYNNLKQRLKSCMPSEVREIKAAMEQLGIKYSSLNTETALAAVVDNGRLTAIRVVFCENDKKDNEPLKENDIYISKHAEIAASNMCINIIIKSMHANGGIFAAGEVNPTEQKKQTVVCLLALVSAGLAEKHKDFVKTAVEFLNGYTYNDMYYTPDREKAREMLSKVFSKNSVILPASPDLISAARFIWRNGSSGTPRTPY